MSILDVLLLLSLGLFYLLFIGRSIVLHKQGIRVFSIGQGKTGTRAVIEMLFVIGLLVWTSELVLHAVHSGFHLLPPVVRYTFWDQPALKIGGLVMIYAGLALFLAALISFGKSWRIGVDTEQPGPLVTGGIYRFSRNPIFLFIDALLCGVFLIYSNLFFLLACLIAAAGIHWQILQEEAFLKQHYGEEYSVYAKRVRRYL